MYDQLPETILGLSLASFFSIVFFIAVLTIVAKWKVYEKAGQPGWASLIPFYNIYIILKIVGKPGWWLLVIIFFPPVGIFLAIWMINLLSKSFGRGIICTLGLIFLSPIFYLLLGFGDAKYIGPAGR
ncbi:MAG: signal peptidase I [Bacteroidales bacterium]|nr:signal peptidase I [Bacteroidales bacterium]